METRGKAKAKLMYSAAAKQRPREIEANSESVVSDSAGDSRNDIARHPPSELHPHQEIYSIQEAKLINSSSLSVPFVLDAFPRCKRSKSRVIPKNVAQIQTAVSCGLQITKCEASQQTSKPKVPAPRKGKAKSDVEVISDSEMVAPSSVNSLHGRRQWRKRNNDNHIINHRQVGKLNTSMFECYLEILWKSFSEEKRNSFAYLDCLWFYSYTKKSSKARILMWIKKKKIFSKKYVFVPIVQWSHWSLLIFCHFGEDLQSETKTSCMLLLDSLQAENSGQFEPGIRKFVLDIYEAEQRPENKSLISKIPLLVPKVPQQRNGKDCGNFVLYYLKLFVENAPENFSISEGYPYFMKEDWFTHEELEGFCKSLEPFSSCQSVDSDT